MAARLAQKGNDDPVHGSTDPLTATNPQFLLQRRRRGDAFTGVSGEVLDAGQRLPATRHCRADSRSGKDIAFGEEGVGGDMGDRLPTRIR
ncbi:hypothetical protein EEB14_54060 [Rhodococcus sp. WS4]|nr:hypothetical protein EEB14_54060 [Rhodococcus sp. WS4]